MPCRITQDGLVIVKSYDALGPTGGGNGNLFQDSCLENSMNSKKRQNDMIPEDETLSEDEEGRCPVCC